MKPCMSCGKPTKETRCEQCAPRRRQWRERGIRKQKTKALGYGKHWQRLSERARKLQPFCSECGTADNLQLDHLPVAHYRQARGLPVRLQDVQVLCARCNTLAGAARPGSPRYEKWYSDYRRRLT